MLSRIRKFQVSCALRCCVVIQNHNQCPTLSGTRRFLATNRAIPKPQDSKVIDNLLERYRDKTIIIDYVGDRYGGNMHGVGMITYLNGDTYEGQLVHNQRHGYGKFVSNDGYIYQGEWVNGSMHGAGTIYYDNGDIFNGQFKDNLRQGLGRLVSHRDKSTYEGEFHNLPHGWGELTLENGDKYEGWFKEGQKSDFGTYTAADGSSYEGLWKQGRKHGQGKEHAFNGDVYVGEHQWGLKVGEGAMTYADGRSYVGTWDADKPNGAGIFTHASGAVQEGFFVDGVYSAERTQHNRLHAKAKASLAPKERVNLASTPPNQVEPSSFPYFTLAEFLRGEISSTSKAVASEAKIDAFDGAVTTGVIHYPLEDLRATYEGGLTAKKIRHGAGKITNRDGTTWVGVFKFGRHLTGEGTLVYNDGRVRVGTWKDGKYVNEKVDGKRLISDTADKAGKKPVSVHKKSEAVDNESLLMYEGEGIDGARHGQGKVIYPDGRTQSGEFYEGQLHQLSKGYA